MIKRILSGRFRIPLPVFAVLAMLIVLMVGLAGNEADPYRLKFTVVGNAAYGTGFTDSRSVGVVRDLVAAHPEVDTLVLGQMPGTTDVDMNRRIARRIRAEGLNTHVPANGYIASGAVDLFLAGVRRTVECGARIGVHSWGSPLGFQPSDGIRDDQRPRQRRLLQELGIHPDFYDFTMQAAGADELYVLTVPDMLRWGVVTEDPGCG